MWSPSIPASIVERTIRVSFGGYLFLSSAEELIEHLKSEKDQLHDQLNELGSEVSSVRLAKLKEVADYQHLFLEERKKNEALT
ncbi:hypothetical protein PIB30_048858 [Stylosanthes scabra]|uniref:Uncharacterized protein n=1 Tax=Stylosanthes scabra TaxID=79078 RepID=A0ABU6XEW2_9FABA|nr:hypothetical protein [Stylosanthes scabra]